MNEHGPYMDHSDLYVVETTAGLRLRKRRCIIHYEPGIVHSDGHFSSGGVSVLANSAHVASGVKGVRVQEDGDLEIITDGSMAPVTSISCDPDETLAARGIDVGPSVGSFTVMRASHRTIGRLYLNRQTHWDLISGLRANSWHMWETVEGRVAA